MEHREAEKAIRQFVGLYANDYPVEVCKVLMDLLLPDEVEVIPLPEIVSEMVAARKSPKGRKTFGLTFREEFFLVLGKHFGKVIEKRNINNELRGGELDG